eukprot:Blabericola_migrator_1__4986@NODE_2591_length_2565_cov_22_006005_g1623_i0_p1_GENE_NODE_2591_length_2565_cov_22_006005_g1623_i0NODE_2591_length_2565_cov_22_006005_g1623_i0_p1_ORF_typecomplete_len112_score10_49_NODE_2591_length_2565_cov_22_006005_g1623_i021752510
MKTGPKMDWESLHDNLPEFLSPDDFFQSPTSGGSVTSTPIMSKKRRTLNFCVMDRYVQLPISQLLDTSVYLRVSSLTFSYTPYGLPRVHRIQHTSFFEQFTPWNNRCCKAP